MRVSWLVKWGIHIAHTHTHTRLPTSQLGLRTDAKFSVVVKWIQQDATIAFILRNGFTLHVSGDNSTHHQKQNALYGLSGRQVYLCCNFVNILVVLLLSVVLSCRWSQYTALYSWWWVELLPETCRVKPLWRINAIVASCWIYFTINL